MLILGIESSCDETGASVISAETNSQKVKLLSNTIASSLSIHSTTGGIIPESAAREQIKFIIPVIKEAFLKADKKPSEIDAIAVTHGPGLVGSLLIGVETAKTLSYVWEKPIIPTNHLIGHIYANFIEQQTANSLQTTAKQNTVVGSRLAVDDRIEFPAIALVVSGGHTDLILMKRHGSITWLGGTRDDAAGEALDKIGRLLGLPYPGGPHIERSAKKGDPKRFNFPSPLINSGDFDFSFSGLKTAVYREVVNLSYSSSDPELAEGESRSRFSTRRVPDGHPSGSNNKKLSEQTVADISASVQKAIIDVLVKKTIKAAIKYNAKSILLGGGVAANSKLREQFEQSIVNGQLSNVKLFAPPKSLCTDNAAMIAAAAYYNNQTRPWQKIDAVPNLYFN